MSRSALCHQKRLLCGLTTSGIVIDNITFDKELWESIKINETFSEDFYLSLFFSE